MHYAFGLTQGVSAKIRGDEEMDDGGPTAGIFYFVFLIIVDLFFYGFGAAIHALNSKEVERKATEEKNGKAEKLYRLICDPGHYINTVHFVVTFVNLTAGGFCVRQFALFVHGWLQQVTLALTGGMMGDEPAAIVSLIVSGVACIFVLLTLGVIIPKRIASRYPESWAYMAVNPVYFATNLFLPFTGLINLTASGILRLLGIKADEDGMDVTEEEIISMVNEGHEQGVLQASEAEMITNIFEFGDKEAQDIMTHRKNILAIDGDMSLHEAISFMVGESNSRYPVYVGDIDHIIGILHFKDAIRYQEQHAASASARSVKSIKGLLREVKFIPETRNLDVLFHNMQSLKIQMVIVIDEYGQTAGLVAMEDILEEIVGNIMDEYDEDDCYIEEKSENEYIIEGLTPLEELEDRFGIKFEEEEFETLNGFLISKMDRIPREDEQFEVEYQGYNFKVMTVKSNVIQTVLVTRLEEKVI